MRQNVKAIALMITELTRPPPTSAEANLLFVYSSGLGRRHAQDKHTAQFLAVLPINRRSANNNRAS